MNTNPKTERKTYQIIPFSFEGQYVGMILIETQPWFIASDIGKILGLTAIRTTIKTFPENEVRIVPALACGQNRKMLVLSVPGLNRLLFLTKKSCAEKLNLWLLTSVLLSLNQIKAEYQIEKLKKENLFLRQLLSKDVNLKKGRHLTEEEKQIIRDYREVEKLSFGEISLIVGRNHESVRRVCEEGKL